MLFVDILHKHESSNARPLSQQRSYRLGISITWFQIPVAPKLFNAYEDSCLGRLSPDIAHPTLAASAHHEFHIF